MGLPARRSVSYCAISFVLFIGLCGCQTASPTAYEFPSTWPGSQPLPENAPTVSVRPVIVDLHLQNQATDQSPGFPTAAVLSVLLVKHLQVNGVNAILEGPEASTGRYLLGCTVLQLGFAQRGGFPQEKLYQAELSCQLTDQQAQKMIWERKLSQRYEDTAIFNWLTKLPKEPHQEDRVLFRECIVPLWDAMASSIGTVVTAHQQANPAVPGPPVKNEG